MIHELTSLEPVRLEAYAARFEDIRIDSSLSLEATAHARIDGAFAIDGQSSSQRVKARLEDAHGKVIRQEEVEASTGLKWSMRAGQVKAWWPIGYGSQPLYTMVLELVAEVRQAPICTCA